MATEQLPSSVLEVLRPWLRMLDDAALECDGMCRVLSALLRRDGISHQVHFGSVTVEGRGRIPMHFWIVMDNGQILDLRARMWLGDTEDVPHGLFDQAENVEYEARGSTPELACPPDVFLVLAGRPLTDFPRRAQQTLPKTAETDHLPETIPQLKRPLTFDQLLATYIPPELDGSNGTNRERHGVNQLGVNTDVLAVKRWLDDHLSSTNTYRAYRKEVERFMNWVLLHLGKPLSSVNLGDHQAYVAFLSDPQPAAFWQLQPPQGSDLNAPVRFAYRRRPGKVAMRNPKRGADNWRPFQGPLDPKSIKQACTILGGMFELLASRNYLSASPWPATKRRTLQDLVKADAAKSRQLTAYQGPQGGYAAVVDASPLRIDELTTCIQWLREQADQAADREKAKFERWLFAFTFMFHTGLRREELVPLRMRHITPKWHPVLKEHKLTLQVMGKGGKEVEIGLNTEARDALARYHRSLHLPTAIDGSERLLLQPIVPKSIQADAKPLTSQTLYELIRDAADAIAGAEILDGFEGDVFRAAFLSPHSFRHLLTDYLAQNGFPADKVKAQLRHESIETTYKHYRSVEAADLAATMEAVTLLPPKNT
jgi:integrase